MPGRSHGIQEGAAGASPLPPSPPPPPHDFSGRQALHAVELAGATQDSCAEGGGCESSTLADCSADFFLQVTMKGALRLLLELWQCEQQAHGMSLQPARQHTTHRKMRFKPQAAGNLAPDGVIRDLAPRHRQVQTLREEHSCTKCLPEHSAKEQPLNPRAPPTLADTSPLFSEEETSIEARLGQALGELIDDGDSTVTSTSRNSQQSPSYMCPSCASALLRPFRREVSTRQELCRHGRHGHQRDDGQPWKNAEGAPQATGITLAQVAQRAARPSRRPRLRRSSGKDRSGSPAALSRTQPSDPSFPYSMSHCEPNHLQSLWLEDCRTLRESCAQSRGRGRGTPQKKKQGPKPKSSVSPRPSQDLCRAEMHWLRVPRDSQHRREAGPGPAGSPLVLPPLLEAFPPPLPLSLSRSSQAADGACQALSNGGTVPHSRSGAPRNARPAKVELEMWIKASGACQRLPPET